MLRNLITLQALNENFDEVIVDVAGRNSKEFISSGVVAHQIIEPLKCSQPDLDTLTELEQQIDAMRNLYPELYRDGTRFYRHWH